jgi:hypothetical protein
MRRKRVGGKETHSSRNTQLQLVNTSPIGTLLPSGKGGYSLASKVGSSRAAGGQALAMYIGGQRQEGKSWWEVRRTYLRVIG